MRIFFNIILLLCIIQLSNGKSLAQSGKIIDHTCSDLDEIPVNWIDSAKANLHIFYARASHGTQLTYGGMTAIINYSEEYSAQYKFNNTGSNGALHLEQLKADLQHQNSTWVATTETYLAENPECNVVMWAWCQIYEQDIDKYLSDLEVLIAEYGFGGTANRKNPVTFVFMTSHTWPWGDQSKWVYEANQKIKNHCELNDRWLYDFYDLECWDPDENYFGDGTPDGIYTGEHRLRWDCSYDSEDDGRGNWGIEWMDANSDFELTKMAADSICVSCKHSDGEGNDDNSRLQCILKGNAAWWLWTSLAGWEPYEPSSNKLAAANKMPVIIYPNPASDIIKLTIPEDLINNSEIKVLNVLGNQLLVKSITTERTQIDLSDYCNGLYFINIEKNGLPVKNLKIVLNKNHN